jgi:hypothetical protein
MSLRPILVSILWTSLILFPAAAPGRPPTTQPADQRSARLIAQLAHDDPRVRDAAQDQLRSVGEAALPALREAAKSNDPELASRAAVLVKDLEGIPFTYTVDYSAAPQLKDWVETKLKPDIQKWYPIICKFVAAPQLTSPPQFTITLKPGAGVAAVGGTRMTVNSAWVQAQLLNPENDAAGAIIHELVHIAQQLKMQGIPVWLVEGMADYFRWFQYEPEARRPKLMNPNTAKYTDSYKQTACFLNYIVQQKDKTFVTRLNAAMRAGQYSPGLWKEYTGATVDELWASFVKWAVETGNATNAARR